LYAHWLRFAEKLLWAGWTKISVLDIGIETDSQRRKELGFGYYNCGLQGL
jgi:hypothetical protein